MSRVNCETYVKKVQRRVNALIKRQNKALAEDELWLGRFYIRQLRRDVYKFEDGSGACVSFLFEMADKKTGKRDIVRLSNYELRVAFKRGEGSWKLFEALNDFIIKKIDVWHEDPAPSIWTPQDYRNVPMLPPMKLKELRKYLY